MKPRSGSTKTFPARWRKIRALGRGGQAQVFLVTDNNGQYDGQYALKLLRPNASVQAYKRFEREVSAIKKLRHPNVIGIVDHSGPTDSIQYYVMEYIESAKTLKDVLGNESNPFATDALRSVDFFIAVVDAIKAWSAQGIVHRDLSPANILLVPPNSRPVVIDFGICQIDDGEAITLADEGLGTRNYAAPETETGSDMAITFQADLYSAGKILWSAVTNQRVYAGQKAGFVGSKSLAVLFPDKPEIWHITHILLKTVRYDPKKRWGDLTMALEECRVYRQGIQAGYPPLEELLPNPETPLKRRCPACRLGWLNITNTPTTLSNGVHAPYVALECFRCGHWSVFNREKQISYRKELKSETQ